jgi:hypothetical protein
MIVTAYSQPTSKTGPAPTPKVSHPGIEEAWILRVMAKPLEERRQPDGRYALWGLVPEAENRALRVITLEDRETVHNALF